MNILDNAINSIIMGIEDYNMNSEKRLTSSTRNIYAGILLLFKHKLVELSPSGSNEVLIKQKLLPKLNETKSVEWVGKGKKTVDTSQIKERFKALNIDVDWKRLEKLNEYRNNIEHYYSSDSKEVVRGFISSSFLIIRDFITNYLEKDPKKLLGIDIWEKLISIDEVYQVEKAECNKTLEFIKSKSDILYKAVTEYNCEECGSDLILYDTNDDFICKSCDYVYSEEALFENALVENIGWRYGEDEELINCPSCTHTTYLVLEKKCLICNVSITDVCIRCGSSIRSDELEESYSDSSGLCSYCICQAHKND